MLNLFENERRSLFNIYDDWVFHYIFSKNTEKSNRALTGILNIILDRKEDPITEIQLQNPIFYREDKEDKESILDIKATTNKGQIVDIEMQNGKLKYFEHRSVFYGCRMGNSALEKNQDYDMMKKSIVISIVNGRLFPSSAKLHTTFQFREIDEHFLLSDRVEIHFVDLSKIDGETPVEEMCDVERLAAYIKYAGDKSKEAYLESLLTAGGETITMVEGLFKELTEDQIAYEQREREFKGMLDRNTAINAAKREGIAEGRAEGRAEGEERMNRLYSRLVEANRFDDMKKAVSDAEFREKLFKEFNL